ncbi:MAG: FAD-dependent oxidoreductase [Bermanella sp.]
MSAIDSARQTTSSEPPRIAVVGAGLAGLSVAWLLKQKYQVTLFESHETPGMGVYTRDYHSNGLSTRIDIPLRIFTQGYYPELFALYQHLDIEMESSDHSSVYQNFDQGQNKRPNPFFQYGNQKVFNKKFSFLHKNSLNLSGLSMVLAHSRFYKQANIDFKENRKNLACITFGQYLIQKKFNDKFIKQLLLPALAVTCTCDYDDILNYPCDLIVEYLTCGVMNQGIVRAKLGVDGIVPKLTQGYDVLCNEKVICVLDNATNGQGIMLTSKNLKTEKINQHAFDYVVMATPANVTQEILSAHSSTVQSTLLSDIPIQSSTMVLHTDTELVYDAQKAAPVSYIIDKTAPRPSTSVDLTKAFSTYKGQASVYQTWNILKAPKQSSVISQADFTRPLVTLKSRQSVAELLKHNHTSAIKICGSYMANKIPLLDAAVESSVKIAKQLDCIIPWHEEVDPEEEITFDPALAY